MNTVPPSPQPHVSPPSVPGQHHDDDSVAGEEDPGAGVDELPQGTPVPVSPAER